MLEVMMEGRVPYVLMGILTVIGIWSKIVVHVSLKRLVGAAGSMNKSNHPLMRLVKAKFEHACMVSDTVENVGVFVDKYLYEYRVFGLRLHTLRRLEKAVAAGCLLVGAAGAAGWYVLRGMGDLVLQTGAAGAALAVLVYLIHLTTDEGYRLDAVKNYMVDYLENVCRHKYEKAAQKELQVMTPEAHPAEEAVHKPVMMIRKTEEPEKEEIEEQPQKQLQAQKLLQQQAREDTPDRHLEMEKQEAGRTDPDHDPEKTVDKNVLIRRILEEYMA